MLKVIESVCSKISEGQKVNPDNLADIIDFLRNFADKCHHAKEEKILFPALEHAGVQREGGPIGVMLHEHEMGRNFTNGMDAALNKNKSDTGSGLTQFVKNAKDYIELLSAHIEKENNVLFVMADQKLSSSTQKEIMEEFERVEREETGEGVHERYHELLHSLKDLYLK